MIKLRACDKNTKHIRGRCVLSENKGITFPSSEEMFLRKSEAMFLRKLEARISEACKGFKYSGITLDFMNIEIK